MFVEVTSPFFNLLCLPMLSVSISALNLHFAGKMNRGLAVIDTMMIIAQGQGKVLSQEDIFLAHVGGWAIEWV
jgi:hypothetical protein